MNRLQFLKSVGLGGAGLLIPVKVKSEKERFVENYSKYLMIDERYKKEDAILWADTVYDLVTAIDKKNPSDFISHWANRRSQ